MVSALQRIDAVQVRSSAGDVEALQQELDRVKRSRGEYAAARVAAVQKEFEKKNQQLQDEMEKKLEAARAKAAQAAQEAAEQAQEAAEQAQAAQEAAEEETALLRAELALLKQKSE